MRYFYGLLLLVLSPTVIADCAKSLVTFKDGQTLQVKEAKKGFANDYELSTEKNRSFGSDGRYVTIDGVRFEGSLIKVTDQYVIQVPASQIVRTECVSFSQTILRLHGSNTIGAKLAPALAKAFLDHNGGQDIESTPGGKDNEKFVQGQLHGQEVVIEIHAHGSSTAFGVSEKTRRTYPNDGLSNRRCDIGMASRKIKDKEKTVLQNIGLFASSDEYLEKSEHVLALDGLPIIVHSSNPINELTIAKISQIFSGQIENWLEVGGKNRYITVYARDDNSGTYDTFKNLVLKPYQVKLTSNAKRYESNQELSREVARDPNAIGFTGLPYIFNNKALKVSDGSFAIAANETTVGTEDYPLSRRLYFYTAARSNNQYVQQFIDFALSEPGQEVVQGEGFVSLNLTANEVALPPISSLPYNGEHDPDVAQNYLNLTSKAKRVSTTFRFQSGSKNLDTRGLRDLQRVADYLNKPENRNKRLFLLGFADASGKYDNNRLLSFARTKSLRKQLEEKGVNVGQVVMCGLAEEYPVASNETETGKQKNRRVEVWIE